MICSPHTRGWPRLVSTGARVGGLLPAHAGMAPASQSPAISQPAAPRTRGDGPQTALRKWLLRFCSPHTRGWPRTALPRGRGAGLLPAHAGMAPRVGCRWGGRRAAPPHAGMAPARLVQQRTPRPAPRTRGDGPGTVRKTAGPGACSPHTRGWPRRTLGGTHDRGLLPAHAGMAPFRGPGRGRPGPAPRTRGDGPPLPDQPLVQRHLLPAHAGMAPPPGWPGSGCRSAPRTRGDGPNGSTPYRRASRCSPHTRGWPRLAQGRGGRSALLPAHAGMTPHSQRSCRSPMPAPRTRGDGPQSMTVRASLSCCSPRTRG